MATALVRIVKGLGAAVAGVLALGVLLVVVRANEDNGLVNAVLEVGRFFAQPFRGIIELDDNVAQIAVNWGIAAVVYLALAAAVAALIRAVAGSVAARSDRRGGRPRRAADDEASAA